MKKKIAKVLVVLIAIIAITGCSMKENLHMKISSNKDVKITLITAMDDEMIDTMISMQESGSMPSSDTEKKTYTDEERWKFLESDENDTISVPSDYTVKKYDKDGFKGYLAEKDLGSIDTMSSEKGTESERINIFSNNDEIFEGKLFIKNGTEYTSNMKIDLTESEDSTEMSSYESYGAVFDMKLVIEFPRVPISHNADEVSADGKTLSWDLLKKNDVEFTFDFKKDGEVVSTTKPTDTEKEPVQEKKEVNILLIAGILGGILVLGIIVIIVIIILVTRKKPQPVQIQQTIEQPQETVNSNPTQQPVEVKVEEHKEETTITTNNTTETKTEVTEVQQNEVTPTQEEKIEETQENNDETKAE